MSLLSVAEEFGAATCLSNAHRPDYRLLSPDANGGHCQSPRPALTRSVRAYFTSTSRRACARGLRLARMHLCGRPEDKRHCRKAACSAPRLLPPSVGNFRALVWRQGARCRPRLFSGYPALFKLSDQRLRVLQRESAREHLVQRVPRRISIQAPVEVTAPRRRSRMSGPAQAPARPRRRRG